MRFPYIFDDADKTEGRSAVDDEIFWPQDEHVRNKDFQLNLMWY